RTRRERLALRHDECAKGRDRADEVTSRVHHDHGSYAREPERATEEALRKQVARGEAVTRSPEDDSADSAVDFGRRVGVERVEAVARWPRDSLRPHVRAIVQAHEIHKERRVSVSGLQLSGYEKRGSGFAGDGAPVAGVARTAQNGRVAVDADPRRSDGGEPLDERIRYG